MKLYNTLTRTTEEIQPLHSDKVTIYTCGPTVYDYPHVGNWFTFVRYDLLVRTLRALGKNPVWVMNITDVGHLTDDADDGEDKLEKGARREGKTAWDVAQFYGDYFVQGLQRLNVTDPQYLPKATEHIAEQIALVERLEEKGYTYTTSDGVYYDTSKFEGYAAFARLDLDDLQAGARVEYNPEKRNITDFALWKFSPKDQQRDMEWDSPWGCGFPGWHIECSAMSMKYLGETIDIHSGGIDHIPVHHTNEIAQSEAATGKRFANYWMHTNHVTVEGEKISKSLGNGITLEDIEAKGYSLEAFRLHVLESHYRSQSKFTWESLEAAQNRLKNLQAFAVLRYQAKDTVVSAASFSLSAAGDLLLEALAKDLDTPRLLATLSNVVTHYNTALLHTEFVTEFDRFLEMIDALLGITLSVLPDITTEQKSLIGQRDEARSAKDWARSDEIRDALLAEGISVRDTPQGTIWARV